MTVVPFFLLFSSLSRFELQIGLFVRAKNLPDAVNENLVLVLEKLINTVEPLHKGFLEDRRKLPLWRDASCKEV